MNQTMTLYAFGLCAAAAALVLLLLTSLFGRRKGLPCGMASLFCAIAIPGAVLMARLFYVALNFKLFTETFENPALMLCFWDGGLSMTGAITGAVLAGLIAAGIAKQPFAKLADAFAVPMGLSLSILFFGEQFTDLGIGKSVSEGFLTRSLPGLLITQKMGRTIVYNLCPWKYEAIAFLLLFGVTLLVFWRNSHRDGDTALIFFALAGAVTILLESMRDDGHMLIIFLRVAQLGGAVMVFLSMGIAGARFRRAGGSLRLVVLSWIAEVVALGGLVMIEFALDGRLSFGAKSLGVNYLAMLGCCALMAFMPCCMISKTKALEEKA